MVAFKDHVVEIIIVQIIGSYPGHCGSTQLILINVNCDGPRVKERLVFIHICDDNFNSFIHYVSWRTHVISKHCYVIAILPLIINDISVHVFNASHWTRAKLNFSRLCHNAEYLRVALIGQSVHDFAIFTYVFISGCQSCDNTATT